MTISGPRSIIANLRNRVRIFQHSKGYVNDAPNEGRPLEEIPGTKANLDAVQKTVEPQVEAPQAVEPSERKG